MTTPALPSTVITSPLWMRLVATPVPITAGMPYSRATMEPWLSGPPMSVTTADAIAKSGVQAGVVVGANEAILNLLAELEACHARLAEELAALEADLIRLRELLGAPGGQ